MSHRFASVLAITLSLSAGLSACAPAAAVPTPSAAQQSAPAQSGGTVTIGVSAPLTGNYAEYGQLWKNAMQLALENVNGDQVIPGKTLQLQFEDSQSDPKQAATIAKKLADDPSIAAVIGDFSSSASLAGAPIYLSAKKVQLSPTASDPSFTASGDYMFSIVGSQNAEAPFLAKMAVQDLGKKKIAIMYINNDWGVVTKNIFVDQAKAMGATIVDQQPFQDADTDFRATLTRLQNGQPDLLFLAGFYQQVALMQKQREDLGWTVTTLTPSSTYSPQLLTQGGDAVEGQYLTAVFFPSDSNQNPKVQSFVNTYRARYKADPNQFAALAYDTVGLLASTIAKTGAEPTGIRDGLANDVAHFVGVTGPMTFSPDRLVAKGYVPLVVKNGQFVLAN